MGFLLIEPFEGTAASDAQQMRRIAEAAGFTKLRSVEDACAYQGHPVLRLAGLYNGHEVEVGHDLQLNIPRPYSLYISVKNVGERRLKKVYVAIGDRLSDQGISSFVWPVGINPASARNDGNAAR